MRCLIPPDKSLKFDEHQKLESLSNACWVQRGGSQRTDDGIRTRSETHRHGKKSAQGETPQSLVAIAKLSHWRYQGLPGRLLGGESGRRSPGESG